MALATVSGKSYALRRDGEWWLFTCLETSVEHRASRDGCTCEDAKFRHRTCKHMRALVALLGEDPVLVAR